MQHQDLTHLANQYGTDKGDEHLCAHAYTRVYEALLKNAHQESLRLLEIGLVHGHTQKSFDSSTSTIGCPSLRMWADFLPHAAIFGFDIVDFRKYSSPRVTIFQGDQSNIADLTTMIDQVGGQFDIIIDDGSHASHHQQITLAALFPHLAPGGLYCIEDLHYQPTDLELPNITTTREFLRDLRFGGSGARLAFCQRELAALLSQIKTIHFFDSASPRWPLAQREDALGIILKKGRHRYFSNSFCVNPHEGDKTSTEIENPKEDISWRIQLPDSFSGHTFLHGERIYCGSCISNNDPRARLGVTANTPWAPSLSLKVQSYLLGDRVDFRQGGNAQLYLRQGWDQSSLGGTWTLAPVARMVLCPEDPLQSGVDWILEITAQGLVGPSHQQTHTAILVNGHSLGEFSFGYEKTLSLKIPATHCIDSEGTMSLEFFVLDAVSPQSQGLSQDQRELGLLFVSLCITTLNPG